MAAIYYSPSLSRRGLLLTFLAGAILILPPAGYGISRFWYGYTRFGPAAAYAWGMPWLATATGLLLAWSLLLFLLLRRASFGVVLYRNGLSLGAVESNLANVLAWKPALFLWEEMTGIAVELVGMGRGAPPLHRATLYFKGNRRVRLVESRPGWLSFPGFFGPLPMENLPELITRVKARFYPRLLSVLQETLSTGAPLPFGPLILHPDCLQIRSPLPPLLQGKRLPWEEIRRVTVQSGALVVELDHQKGRFSICIPISKIPNLELLLGLIDSTAGCRQGVFS